MKKHMKVMSLVLTVLMVFCASGVSAFAVEDGALISIGFAWDGGMDEATEITGSQFEFSGNLSTFDFDGLTNIVLFVNGVKSDVKLLSDDPCRRYDENRNITEFCFYYEKAQLAHPAEYVLTCQYRGEQWQSTTLTWNADGTIEFDDSTIGIIGTEPPAPSLIAKPTASTVLVNGENVAFDAYNINGNNYFKLRDLAYILSGTEKQFEVGWDGANNAISLTSGKAYTAVGGEMTGKGAGNKTPTPTSSKILLDGKEVSFTAYNIEGNNYFKLRDIGQAFDFGVDWDGANNTIVIDTSKGYTPD